MQWWLTVFFLLGGSWVSGDRFDGWGSRAYPSEAECEARRQFAEWQTARHPLDVPARWICSRERPATLPPDAPLNVKYDTRPWPREVHWYEPSNPPGLEVFTRDNLPWMAPDGVGLRYTGALRSTLADDLRKLLLAEPQRFDHAVLELDSDGGQLEAVKDVVAVLREARRRMDLTTRVMEGSLCASGCIPIFMQGRVRKASGSSIWVFHGARGAFSNVPDPTSTEEYLDLLSTAGMKPGFRAMLEDQNRIFRPGSFILSGYELFSVHGSGIITELFPVWREENPVLPAGMGPR